MAGGLGMDTIAESTAAAMKPHGGRTPGLIRSSRLARCGLKRIRYRGVRANLPVDPAAPAVAGTPDQLNERSERRVGGRRCNRKTKSVAETVSQAVA